jgi:hypothetical protein
MRVASSFMIQACACVEIARVLTGDCGDRENGEDGPYHTVHSSGREYPGAPGVQHHRTDFGFLTWSPDLIGVADELTARSLPRRGRKVGKEEGLGGGT